MMLLSTVQPRQITIPLCLGEQDRREKKKSPLLPLLRADGREDSLNY